MAGSVNRVILIGNLGRDPEVRFTPGGDQVASFSLATSEQWKNRAGDKEEKTNWHRVTTWGRLAEISGEYLKKGSQVYIEGRIDYRKFTDKDGVEKYSTDIVADRMQMLSKKSEGAGDDAPRRPAEKEAATTEIGDEDVPF